MRQPIAFPTYADPRSLEQIAGRRSPTIRTRPYLTPAERQAAWAHRQRLTVTAGLASGLLRDAVSRRKRKGGIRRGW